MPGGNSTFVRMRRAAVALSYLFTQSLGQIPPYQVAAGSTVSQEIRSILLADSIRGRENDPSNIDGLQPSVLSQRNGFIPVQHKAIQIHHVPGHALGDF